MGEELPFEAFLAPLETCRPLRKATCARQTRVRTAVVRHVMVRMHGARMKIAMAGAGPGTHVAPRGGHHVMCVAVVSWWVSARLRTAGQ